MVAQTMQFASSKDANPVLSYRTYYGIIQEIWELDYEVFHETVFLCDWVKDVINVGYKIDDFGFTLVNLSRISHTDDPFTLALHAKQVFYVSDQIDPIWSVVLTPPQKEFYHCDVVEDDDSMLDTLTNISNFSNKLPNVRDDLIDDDDSSTWTRSDCEGIYVYDQQPN